MKRILFVGNLGVARADETLAANRQEIKNDRKELRSDRKEVRQDRRDKRR